MHKYDLKDYIKIYDKAFDEKFCNDIVEYLNYQKWSAHSMADYDGNEYTDDTELSVFQDRENIFSKHVAQVTHKAISKYILEDFVEYGDWFSGWNDFSPPRYNRYDIDTQMKIHCDHIHTLFDGTNKGIPILTVLGAFNNNYFGGDFIMFNELNIKLKAGQIMIFPSNFMYPHKVLPVKSGVRYTFVSWAW